VQGVGYRAWTEREAEDRDLSGWVRNRRDGTVEALFSGSAETVVAMIAACRSGPPAAVVVAIDEFEASDDQLALRGDHQFIALATA
jgi:acylphosphatase